MNHIKIDPLAIEAIKNFTLPDDLTFGKVLCPVMIECDYQDGKWGEAKMVPYRKLELDPTCKVLHYAQEIFEGLKGYKVDNNGPFLFRADQNAKRFDLSAERMAMPTLPENLFMESVQAMVSYNANFIPRRTGDSLYIRPFMFATDNHLGIKPSESYKYMVVASPSSAYFSSGSVRVLIERSAVRASEGGVGAAKTGGNYAASLLSMVEAKKKGFDQVLWLDGKNKSSVEEMSGMNFFALYGDVLKTPKLTQTILNGITRDSIIKMAKKLGYTVEEIDMNIDELINDIKEGKCTECFACGTAVIITPINALGEHDGSNYPLNIAESSIAMKIRNELLNIQEGRSDDPFSWRTNVEPAVL
jgi:branched-chain amino acid aminotransferase